MQTPKSRPGSLDVHQKPSTATPRTNRKLKTPGSDSDSISSPNPISKTPKDRIAKAGDRRSPQSPATQKKRTNKGLELEPQLAQLQDELKKLKDQLSSSESLKRKAQQETENAKEQLAAMSFELEETQSQLKDISNSEEARIQELRKVSQDRDKAWQSEVEAIQKQHSMDSAALSSAMNEIQRLKIQLDRISESESSQARHAESAYAEIQSLRLKLTETLELVEKLKNQLNDSRESEALEHEEVSRIQMELEVVKNNEEKLKSEHDKAVESYKSLLLELEQSKARVSSLEELVGNLQADLTNSRQISEYASDDIKNLPKNGECDEMKLLKTELNNVKDEASQLRDALEAAETRYRDEYIQSNLEIRNTYALVDHAKSEMLQVKAELEEKLQESMADIEELRFKLIEKETVLQSISCENNKLNLKKQEAGRETELEIELKKMESTLQDLKAGLLDKEMRLQSITEENEMLKSEIKNKEIERSKANDDALGLAKAAEREALMKLCYLTEEADKSCRKAARVTEQLDAAQVVNSEMEAELRRLKVQSDQWRKAAEVATAMLSTGNNGKHAEKMGSLGSPFSDDSDDDSSKKKNGNMLKKIGVLLKKGQK